MAAPISIRLDDEVRQTLEGEAQAQGLPLATLLRQIAADAAREVRRARIRAQSETVGRHVATSPDAATFLADLGRPVDRS